jgi:predicted HTH transcriptional regulator
LQFLQNYLRKISFAVKLSRAPSFRNRRLFAEKRTRVTLYSYKPLNDLDKKEKIRACYQHACLKYVSNEKMTNQSLRERFKIDDHNYSIASRIIRDALEEKMIKEDDPENKSRKYACYIPFWA